MSTPTPICKNCFKDIKNTDLYTFFNKNATLCPNCISTFEPIFENFKIGKIKALAIYEYDALLKDLIYKFKGCYDYELHSIFLEQYKRELSMLFRGYKMIPAPSYKDDDSKRGYNHVVEIFKSMSLPLEELFEKTEKFKQADHNFRERKKINKYIKIKDNATVDGKVLLVDDIYTTGATIQTMISLLNERGIREIKVLVLCKTKLTEKSSKD